MEIMQYSVFEHWKTKNIFNNLTVSYQVVPNYLVTNLTWK